MCRLIILYLIRLNCCIQVLAKEVKSLRRELETERSSRAVAEKQLADVTAQAATREASSSGQQQLLEELQARLSTNEAELVSGKQNLSEQVQSCLVMKMPLSLI